MFNNKLMITSVVTWHNLCESYITYNMHNCFHYCENGGWRQACKSVVAVGLVSTDFIGDN